MNEDILTIGIVTVGRSDLGILKSTIDLVESEKLHNVILYVSSGHLLSSQGNTGASLSSTKKRKVIQVPSAVDGQHDSHNACQSISSSIVQFSNLFKHSPPDILIIMGDRYDMFAPALAAVMHTIPILHMHGGELSQGAIDDQLRHALSKFAHLHVVAHETYRDRVLQLGEEAWRVEVVGAPALDLLKTMPRLTKTENAALLNIAPSADYFVITYHPETLAADGGYQALKNLLSLLKVRPEFQFFTASNIDPGTCRIMEEIADYCEETPQAKLVKSFGSPRYYQVLSHAKLLLGNSSSGILESPTFGLPTINIGDRQNGRFQAMNIISCNGDTDSISLAIQKGLSKQFHDQIKDISSPFDKGGAANKIIRFIEREISNPKLRKKSFQDYSIGSNGA